MGEAKLPDELGIIMRSNRTAAIRYHNGSVRNIAVIPGGPEYEALFHRYATEPPGHYSWGDLPFWEGLKVLTEQARRRLRRMLGLPATQDIGTIASLIHQLKGTVEAELQISVTGAVTSMPNLFGAHTMRRSEFQEDLEEATAYSGVTPLLSPFWLSTPSAVAASQGLGLCENYTDAWSCAQEEHEMPVRMVVTVEYTIASLIVTLFPLQSAGSNSDEHTVIDFAAGARNQDSPGYWHLVRERLLQPFKDSGRPVDEVLLTGDCAHEPKFLDVLRDALGPLVSQKEGAVQQYFLYSAARGAAEIAKRVQERPNGCSEPARCKDIRKLMVGNDEKEPFLAWQEEL
jgi:hypothetical protein